MAGIEKWEHFFKPEARSSGRTLVKQGKVSLARPSDTEVVAFIRVSPSLRVILKSPSIESPIVFAQCACPSGKKGLFCKHLWASLLVTDEKNSDFFDSKTEIEILADNDSVKKKGISSAGIAKPREASSAHRISQNDSRQEAREAAQKALKEKQSLYRKIQYQKQKLRQKEFKKKRIQPEEISYPAVVEVALEYFSKNGFELRSSLTTVALSSAKKTLARVFHPDLGGSHEEILELNRHSENLEKYLRSQNK